MYVYMYIIYISQIQVSLCLRSSGEDRIYSPDDRKHT